MKQPRDNKGRFSKMISSLKNYLDTTPAEQKEKDWQEVKSLNLKGPTAKELVDSFKVKLYKETITSTELVDVLPLKDAVQYQKKYGGSYIIQPLT